jgi:protein SCO1
MRFAAALTILLAASAAAQTRSFAFPDVVVQTQDGRRVHFYDDLVKGRVVAIDFIFTNCTTVCPLMGARFARLQSLLGRRAHDVALVSISIDPTNDTPARLAAWSKRFGARPGWTLVTGAKSDIDNLLRAAGVGAGDPSAHVPVILLGDDRTGAWQRVDGLTEPTRLASLLDNLLAREPR